MKIIKQTMGDKTYNVTPSGTYYHIETPNEIIKILENARINKIRIRLHYGDVKTGKDWNEKYNVTGTLGRSMGPVKMPILLYNKRSISGPAILDHCIVRIVTAEGKQKLYQVSNYHE